MIESKPYKKKAYRLFHEGAIALAGVEANGMRVDTDYLARAIEETEATIREKGRAIRQSEVVLAWKKHFRAKTNLGSHDQLGKVLFEIMGFECPTRTRSGKYSTDEETLASVDHPFVRDYLEIEKLKKAQTTYLEGIRDEAVDGFLHPSFTLHLAKSFRSSSSDPNLQNIPVRNSDIRKLVRSAFVAREGRRLVEVDYRGIEVCGAACYHKDPTMIRYIEDKSRDMHRDMAAELYMLPEELVQKTVRYCAKNMFVFPQFYGSYWAQCAPNLWAAIDRLKLTRDCWACAGRPGAPHGCDRCGGTGQVSLKRWLKKRGISGLGSCSSDADTEPGTFAHHVRKVERGFWGERFPVYAQWKKDWYDLYRDRGWASSKTGFVYSGFMKRTEVINYPIQGSSFHCLLWSLNELQLRRLAKAKLETLLVNQIHDSLVADVPEGEVEEYVALAEQVMTRDLVEQWRWICVPLEIEVEVTPVGGCWEEKKALEKSEGGFALDAGDEAKRKRFVAKEKAK